MVGVTPADFTGTNPLRNDVWTPLPARKLLRPNDPSVTGWLTSPDYCCTPIAGRLAPGVTRTRAQAELAILLDQFRTANRMSGQRASIVLAGTAWMDSPRKKRQVIPMMLTMFFAVTLVLLLACANVGNLLLARAAARRQEIAVRLSIGARRFRIVRQLLVESMLLALAAAALGLATAFVAPVVVMHRLAEDQAFHVRPDPNVLAYTIAVAILACLAFGLAPALHGTRVGISMALKAGAGPGGAEQARLPLRSVLLAVQVAISVVLLANAGLLVRGMQRAQALDPGFDVQKVTVLSIDLPASQYSGPRTKALTSDLMAQLEHSSDLPACGLTLNPPLSNATYSTSFQLTGSSMLHIYSNEVSGGYVDALGMRLLAGRNFVPEDTARNVVMINEAAAKRWWRGESPLGKTILADAKMRQIVGVISDTYTNDLSSIEAVIYFPITGRGGAPFIVVRDRGVASVDHCGPGETDRAASPGSRGAAGRQFPPQVAAFDLRFGIGGFPRPAGAGDRFGGDVGRVRLRGGPAHTGDRREDGAGRAALTNRAVGARFERGRADMRPGLRDRLRSGHIRGAGAHSAGNSSARPAGIWQRPAAAQRGRGCGECRPGPARDASGSGTRAALGIKQVKRGRDSWEAVVSS